MHTQNAGYLNYLPPPTTKKTTHTKNTKEYELTFQHQFIEAKTYNKTVKTFFFFNK